MHATGGTPYRAVTGSASEAISWSTAFTHDAPARLAGAPESWRLDLEEYLPVIKSSSSPLHVVPAIRSRFSDLNLMLPLERNGIDHRRTRKWAAEHDPDPAVGRVVQTLPRDGDHPADRRGYAIHGEFLNPRLDDFQTCAPGEIAADSGIRVMRGSSCFLVQGL
jgi:hypothetical protein